MDYCKRIICYVIRLYKRDNTSGCTYLLKVNTKQKNIIIKKKKNKHIIDYFTTPSFKIYIKKINSLSLIFMENR